MRCVGAGVLWSPHGRVVGRGVVPFGSSSRTIGGNAVVPRNGKLERDTASSA